MRNRGTPKSPKRCPKCGGTFYGKAFKHHRCIQLQPEPGEQPPPTHVN